MTYEACTICGGSGYVTVDWGDAPCPECRLRARLQPEPYFHQDCLGCELCEGTTEAIEGQIEQAYKDVYGPDYDKLATYQAEGR